MNGILILKDGTKLRGRVVSRTKTGRDWSCRMVFDAAPRDWNSGAYLQIGTDIEPCITSHYRGGANLNVVKVMSNGSSTPPWR